jgi:chitodextrinase
MNNFSKLALASSVTLLLSACGANTSIPTEETPGLLNGSQTGETSTTAPSEKPNNTQGSAGASTDNSAPHTQQNTNQETGSSSMPGSDSDSVSDSSSDSDSVPDSSTDLDTNNSQEATTQNDDPFDAEPNIEYGTISLAYLNEQETQLGNSDLMTSVKESIATLDNASVEMISPLRAANPENVRRLESIVSESDWDYLFAKRAPEYSYDKFLKAVGKFPAFCGDYDDGRDADAICRKSLATMFAHFTQETGGHTAHWDVEEWRQGLVHVREMGWDETMRGGYNGECNPDVWQGQTWPCGQFENGDYKSYFGRGAKQLSYNYNYGPFSEAMYGDVRVLLDNPEWVADTWLNLASAVFFYVYPQPPKPSMLHVIDGTWQPNERDLSNGLTLGFGVTTQIINGGVECGGTEEVAQSLNRISYYESFANYLGVSIAHDEVLGCAGMKQFDSSGSGALNIYWEQDWSYVSENPDGKSFACKLVGYQTPFSAFKEGDYVKCVEHHFDVRAVD